jgi:two-component system, NtrC family, response regulator HydG
MAIQRPEPLATSAVETRSENMQRVLDLARRVAKVDSTALIQGESGSGKEGIARLLHAASARASGPFVAVNCAAIPESLLESELFGHARGSFSGATQERPGLFEAAEGGTLFLDEVAELPAGVQAKLLRALQEREVRRVGENRSRPFHVRILAATNRSLADEVNAGRFRSDLYYRLKVVELFVPPLRQRREDVLPLAREMVAAAAARNGRAVPGIGARTADLLLAYTWPGNVRELENAMERAAAIAEGPLVEPQDLPEEVRLGHAPTPGLDRVRPLEDIEREYILAALAHNRGNQTRTAHDLRIGTTTLYRKLKAYGISKPRKSTPPMPVGDAPRRPHVDPQGATALGAL